MNKTLKIYCNGTQRVLDPSDTIKKARRYFKDFGITRVANITGLDVIGIPVAVACRPNSRALSVSQGKGITYESALASAIMESVEVFHAERIFNPTCILSYEDIFEKNNVIDIENLTRLNSSSFTKKTKIPWVQGYDLFSNKNTWVPFECVHTDYTCPWPSDHGHFIADSNGLASGNTLNEAINHGLFEVIERDALALWALKTEKQKKLKKLKISSINAEFLKELINKIKSKNIGLAIWDITTNLQIPTYICKIIDCDESNGLKIRPAYGSGTHINSDIALSRAITEAAQSRLTFISGSRDDQYKSVYESQVSREFYQKWYDEIVIQKECYNYQLYNDPANDFLEDDQEFILKKLKKFNLNQAVCVNLTRSQYDIPVVKIIIPGLEGVSFPGERLLGKRGAFAYSQSGVGACAKIF